MMRYISDLERVTYLLAHSFGPDSAKVKNLQRLNLLVTALCLERCQLDFQDLWTISSNVRGLIWH